MPKKLKARPANGPAPTLIVRGRQRGALPTLLLLSASPAFVGCSDSPPSQNVDGRVRGELHIYRVNYDDGRSSREFYLAPDEHTPATTRLVFAEDPGLEPWTRLEVWGPQTTDGVKVTRFEVEPADDVASQTQALTTVTPRPRTVGFVLMDVGSGVNLSAESARAAVFGNRSPTQAGLNQYYREVSYGAVELSGEILGPAMTSALGSCQQSTLALIENGWPEQFGQTFNHWLTYIGSKYASCGWTGIGGEGTASRPARTSWFNGSSGCTVLAQEFGHNFGLMHSGSLTCDGASFADDPLTCMGSEFGNRNTVMGSGCAHLNAHEKWYQGYFGGCNAVRVAASGTFTLYPTELPCDGVQALQIPMPKARPFKNTSGATTQVTLTQYYLELRTKTGIDGNVTTPNVMVTVGADVPRPLKTSQFTWNLDMDPGTTSADGMVAGQTFEDPAGGLSFTVQDVSATHATINVTMADDSGTSTCMDGSTFTPPGSSDCSSLPSGGSSGAAGTGGAAGMGGAAGASGSGGRGGGEGTAGHTNTGGDESGGAPSGSGGGPTATASGAGCGCRTTPTRARRLGEGAFALLAAALMLRRRRAGA